MRPISSASSSGNLSDLPVGIAPLDDNVLCLRSYPNSRNPCAKQPASSGSDLDFRLNAYEETYAGTFFGCCASSERAKREEHRRKAHSGRIVLIMLIVCLMAVRPAAYRHLITLFARSSTRTGIVRPICFAAFKLMTNSNFVACCTGRSAGLAPFKILST